MLLALLLAAQLTMPTPDLTARVRSKGVVVRSMGRRAMFLRALGYKDGKVPKGFAVDHLVPLFCGGADTPGNMQLLTIAEWRAKSKWERQPCSAWWDGTHTRAIQAARDQRAH